MNSLLTESYDLAYLDPTSKPPMTRNSVSLIFTVQLLRNVKPLRGWGPSRHRLESSRKNWLLQVRYGHQSIFRLLLLRFFGSNLNKRPKVRSALIKVKKQEESINIFTYKKIPNWCNFTGKRTVVCAKSHIFSPKALFSIQFFGFKKSDYKTVRSVIFTQG